MRISDWSSDVCSSDLAFSETDFTEDLKAIEVPVLVIHSEDDQIVPYANSAPLTVKLLKHGTLRTYKDLPHGLCQTHPDIVNTDILAFIRGESLRSEEHTSELQSLMRISYAVFCLHNKKTTHTQ